MSKPVYKFPCGMEIEADLYPKHYCDAIPLVIMLVSGVKGVETKYFNNYTAETVKELQEKYPDSIYVKRINQLCPTKGLVDSDVYYYVGKLTEPVFPVKEFEYSEPASNTSSNYKVNITISSEEGYSRTFCVDVPTRNFTAYAAMERAIETLHEELLLCKHDAMVPVLEDGEEDKDGYVYAVEMYNKYGDSYMHEFENDRFDPPFKKMITALVISDFEMIIDGDQSKVGEINDRRE